MLKFTETIQHLQAPPNQPHDRWVPTGYAVAILLGIALQTQKVGGHRQLSGRRALRHRGQAGANLPDWMVEHANRHLSSGDADGHMRLLDVEAQISVFANRLTPETINRMSTARRKLTSLNRR